MTVAGFPHRRQEGTLRSVRAFVSLVVFATVAAACGGTSAPAETEDPQPTTTLGFSESALVTYTSTLGFSIDYPADWTVEEDEAAGIVTFTGPTVGPGFSDNFNVVVGEVGNLLPVAYYDAEVQRIRSVLPDAEILEEATVTIDGVPGRGITLTATQDGVPVGISRMLFLRDGTAYEVTFVTTADRLGLLSKLVQRIFASFRFSD